MAHLPLQSQHDGGEEEEGGMVLCLVLDGRRKEECVYAHTLWKLRFLEFPNGGDMTPLLSWAGDATPCSGAWLTLSFSSAWTV
jgi:hypothetical protein